METSDLRFFNFKFSQPTTNFKCKFSAHVPPPHLSWLVEGVSSWRGGLQKFWGGTPSHRALSIDSIPPFFTPLTYYLLSKTLGLHHQQPARREERPAVFIIINELIPDFSPISTNSS